MLGVGGEGGEGGREGRERSRCLAEGVGVFIGSRGGDRRGKGVYNVSVY